MRRYPWIWQAVLLILATLVTFGHAFAQAQTGFVGNWLCQSAVGQAALNVTGPNTLSFDGESMQYQLQGNVVTVIQHGVRRPHGYAMKDSVLHLQSPEGIALRCERVAGAGAAGVAAGTGGANQNHLLAGTLCSFSASSGGGSSYQSTSRVRFDGQGRFSTGAESSFSGNAGGGYGQSAGNGGTYMVTGAHRGALIQVRWNNGETDSATVHHVVNGRITEIMYGKRLLGTGLC